MDLFGGFRDDRNLDDMMKSLNDRLRKFGFEPFNFDFDMKMESGIDAKDGEWTKSTYTSEDGSTTVVTMSKGFGGKKPNTNMSNNIDYLKFQLDKAVESQDFEKAVELRDRISKLKDVEGKVKELEVELSKAIKEQKFERCIEIRDEIKNLRK